MMHFKLGLVDARLSPRSWHFGHSHLVFFLFFFLPLIKHWQLTLGTTRGNGSTVIFEAGCLVWQML